MDKLTKRERRLLVLADDLVDAIQNAYWKRGLTGPTLHMEDAIAAYQVGKGELNRVKKTSR